MIDGKSSKDWAQTKTFMQTKTDYYNQLMEIILKATCHYLEQQIKSGAEVIKIFDSWAGTLDYESFKEYVIKPTKKIVKYLKSKYPHIKIIGFAKGAGTNITEYTTKTGIDCVALDQTFNVHWVKENLLEQGIVVQGNLENTSLIAGGDILDKKIKNIINTWKDYPFIFNLGHGILPNTPPSNVKQAVDLIKSYSK